MLPMVAVVALKVTDVAPAAIVNDAGTVRVELVLDRVMVAPPVGAPWVRVKVQVLKELGPRLVGLHASDDTSTDVTKPMVALAEVLL